MATDTSPFDENDSLAFTGERFIPGSAAGDIELEHLHRYLLACELVTGKAVLDIASGEGYGSAMLARYAGHVIGVDISEEAIFHAQKKYHAAQNLEFLIGTCSAIPVADATVDVVVSFETIEHHSDHEEMMLEIKRVLKSDGVLIISSPDKLEYSDKPGYVNDYHVKELYRGEFEQLLSRHFKGRRFYGQRVAYGSVVLREGDDGPVKSYVFGAETQRAYRGIPGAIYLIAVASDSPPPDLNSGLLDLPLSQSSAVKNLHEHIHRLEHSVCELKDTVNSLIVERNAYQSAIQDSENEGTSNSVIVEYKKQLDELSNRSSQTVYELQDSINSLIIERDIYQVAVRALEDQVMLQTSRYKSAKKQLSKVYASKSWRVTAPLRRVVRLFLEIIR